jgi:UDP-3-O-[3-hydroxymyristoyl] N-acetylglucosamine deacetylase
MIDLETNSQLSFRAQNTLRRPIAFSGIGIHTGTVVSLRFCPASENNGIIFKRVDLPNQPIIPASLEYVCDTSRSTVLGIADIRIYTVEHVLAALRALNVDNLIIEISSIEPPVGNGSSDVFVKLIEEAGISPQQSTIPILKLQKPVYFSEGDTHIVAIPSNEYRISYTLNYPESKVLKCQYQSLTISSENFKKEIAPCRTFSRYEEISLLMDRGLIKGGSLDNAVIIYGDAVFSKDGLFFPDEMVRHKILDMIGDLSLIGLNFFAHIIAVRSGHKTNAAFAKKLFNTLTMENTAWQQPKL